MKSSITKLSFEMLKGTISMNANLYNSAGYGSSIYPNISNPQHLTDALLNQDLGSVHSTYRPKCSEVFTTMISFWGPKTGFTEIITINRTKMGDGYYQMSKFKLSKVINEALDKNNKHLDDQISFYFDPVFIYLEHWCGTWYRDGHDGDWSDTTNVYHDFYTIGPLFRNQFKETLEKSFFASPALVEN
jgi:hypothetical protein